MSLAQVPSTSPVLDGRTIRRALHRDVDVVIIGSGPGGAPVADVLARAGMEVLVVEEGPPAEGMLGRDAFTAMATLYRQLGATVALGPAPLPLVQGRAVGGTSVVNGAISWRLPRDVLEGWWREDPALAEHVAWDRIEAITDEVERRLGIAPTEGAVAGAHNTLLARGAEALGLEHRPISRNTNGCRGLGQCLQGCPEGNKMSMDRVYLRTAVEHGAVVLAGTTVRRIRVQGGRAVGVEGTTAGGARVAVRARHAVVLAAGAIGSPVLLMRSGITDGPVGHGLMCHPGVSVGGVFPGPVEMWRGATQGHEVTGLRREGLKFEALGYDLALVASRLKSTGRALSRDVAGMDHVAQWGCAVKAAARGRVRAAPWGPVATYALSTADMRRVRRGVRVLCDLMLAAGAREVHPGVHGMPAVIRTRSDAALMETSGPLDARAYTMAATHLFGTCRADTRPGRGVVDGRFRHHRVRNLLVTDASAFPANTGVNPQTSIVALATLAARGLLGT